MNQWFSIRLPDIFGRYLFAAEVVFKNHTKTERHAASKYSVTAGKSQVVFVSRTRVFEAQGPLPRAAAQRLFGDPNYEYIFLQNHV